MHWQYHNLAPLAPCYLVEIAGWRDVLAVPGITQYTPYANPGQPLRDGVMTRPLDQISGQADSYEQLVEQLATALDHLTFTFDFPRGQETLRAKELAAQPPDLTGRYGYRATF
ncbi:hypothetical protein JOF56_009279 [Kibdelosporangium banguiense]|uniref:Uncharacterized protein n=1 Tax=Kibdelosporangium banguiense TaxID=1365924 RepID=A0ABS4TWY5_9PSEU|nr:hypothetical protein [Kibdelosporangium banguiense]MBP2328894.1 hypothetical protein [Kibdelosporangium banguiense]